MTHQAIVAIASLSAALQGPSLPGAPASPAPAAAGADAVPSAPVPASGAGGRDMIIMIGVMLGAMVLFSFVGGRREKKKREQLLASIKRHDKVVTIGGIVGSVVEMKDDSVVLKVDETSNTRITFAKTAISQVIPQDTPA